jgi:hypothetical protein
MTGNRPWDDRPAQQKAYDYLLNLFFTRKGSGPVPEEPDAYAVARQKGFIVEKPPTVDDGASVQRTKTLRVFDDLASQYGLNPKAVQAARDAAAKLPQAEVGPFLARFAVAASKRGLSAPIDRHALDALAGGPVAAPQVQPAPTKKPTVGTAGTAGTSAPATATPPAAPTPQPVQAPTAPAPRVIALAGRDPGNAAPVELRPTQEGAWEAFIGGKALRSPANGAVFALPAGVSDLEAKRALRQAGLVSANLNFYPARPLTSAESSRLGEVQLALEPMSPGAVLQNRDRSTPASVAQMQAIAKAPDFGRLGFSRDFGNGAPVVAGGKIPAGQYGRSDTAVQPDGTRVPVRYAVVEADQLLPSNKADGSANAGYSDPGVKAVRAIAGNARVAALQSAYEQGQAGTYRAELQADALHGVPRRVIGRMKAPVLVRVMPQSALTNDIGDRSNQAANLVLSPTEQARNDAGRIDLGKLDFTASGEVTPESVRRFVQAMPVSEQGPLIDTTGAPTRQAVDRVHAAIFRRAYDSDALVRLYAQAADPEVHTVMSALAQAAPAMSKLKDAGDLDIRAAVTDAAEAVVNARRRGIKVSDIAAQADIGLNPEARRMLDLFAANPRSPRPIAEGLVRAADLAYAEATKDATDLLGAVPRATRRDVLSQLKEAHEIRPTPQDAVPVEAPGAAGPDKALASPQPAPQGPGRAGPPRQEKVLRGLTPGDAPAPAAPAVPPAPAAAPKEAGVTPIPRGKPGRILDFDPVTGGDDAVGTFEIKPARYLPGKVAVRAPPTDGVTRSRAGRLAQHFSGGTGGGVDPVYIMSPLSAEKFQRAVADGSDASPYTGKLIPPPLPGASAEPTTAGEAATAPAPTDTTTGQRRAKTPQEAALVGLRTRLSLLTSLRECLHG